MQPEERDLIAGLFGRLKEFEGQPRDAEAERLIGTLGSGQPAAGYLLVQTVLVQEQALKVAQERIADLEAKVGAAPAPASGFLGSAPKISPWGSGPAASPTRSPLQAAVAPAPAPAQAPAGGGFMRQALATAAGVAGGALLFEGIRNMMGGHAAGPLGGAQANALDPSLMPPDPGQLSSVDLAQDDGAADDYDTASDDSDSGGFDSGGSDNV
ncbi:MAG: DUF2076 domain-containing protein [Reyranellales bacterium]